MEDVNWIIKLWEKDLLWLCEEGQQMETHQVVLAFTFSPSFSYLKNVNSKKWFLNQKSTHLALPSGS